MWTIFQWRTRHLCTQILIGIYWVFYMAVTVIDFRVFQVYQRPKPSQFFSVQFTIWRRNIFFVVKCSAGYQSAVFESHTHLNCSVVMVGLGVCKHFLAFLVKWLPVRCCQEEAQAGIGRQSAGKLLSFCLTLSVVFTKSQSQLLQPLPGAPVPFYTLVWHPQQWVSSQALVVPLPPSVLPAPGLTATFCSYAFLI